MPSGLLLADQPRPPLPLPPGDLWPLLLLPILIVIFVIIFTIILQIRILLYFTLTGSCLLTLPTTPAIFLLVVGVWQLDGCLGGGRAASLLAAVPRSSPLLVVSIKKQCLHGSHMTSRECIISEKGIWSVRRSALFTADYFRWNRLDPLYPLLQGETHTLSLS